MGQGHIRSLEPHLGLPCGWQVHKYLNYHLLPSGMCINPKLSIQDLNYPIWDAGTHNSNFTSTHQAPTPPVYYYFHISLSFLNLNKTSLRIVSKIPFYPSNKSHSSIILGIILILFSVIFSFCLVSSETQTSRLLVLKGGDPPVVFAS